MEILIAILAGGQSRRMGRDKAWIKVGGSSMLERIAESATSCGSHVAIIGRSAEQVPGEFKSRFPSIRIIPDEPPNAGPLGGLVTALANSASCDAVALLPCDAPRIRKKDIAWLCEQAAGYIGRDHKQAAVPVHDDKLEPLFAAYACSIQSEVNDYLKAARELGKSGSMRGLLESLDCAFIQLPAAHLQAVDDADTPGQLDAMQLE